ncbi:MAG: diguanylate cyclase with sensor [Haloplasmataceae bacterium]|jgi:diguanylate cyclase (GGDEF)-like protein/PAS domain S-box-containing protein|nr:diguanylate cyclase with sensor [Haloplasmataceae bacterium]
MINKGYNFKNFSLDELKNYIHLLFTKGMQFDEVINEVIELVGISLVADTVYFDTYSNECFSLANKFEWCKNSKNKLNLLARLSLPFLFDACKNQHYLLLNDQNDIKNYSVEIKKLFKILKIKTLLVYPIKVKEQIVATMGIVYYNKKGRIDEKRLELLLVIENAMSNYYLKQNPENKTNFLIDCHKKLLNNFTYPIVLLNREYNVIDVNSKFERIFNIEYKDIIQKNFIDVISNYDRKQMLQAFEQALNNTQCEVEIFKIVNNEKKIFGLTPFPIITDNFDLLGIVIKDITIHKVAESKLKKMAFFDSTTGLHNRNYFDQICEDIYNHDYHTIGVIVLDIDNLKVINDKYGHDAGDHLIVKISKILYEVFNDEFLVARIGGDEFAVFILNRTDSEVKELIEVFNNKITYHNRYNEVQLCLSIGYDYQEGKTDSILDLINKADENMYINKKRKNKSLII